MHYLNHSTGRNKGGENQEAGHWGDFRRGREMKNYLSRVERKWKAAACRHMARRKSGAQRGSQTIEGGELRCQMDQGDLHLNERGRAATRGVDGQKTGRGDGQGSTAVITKTKGEKEGDQNKLPFLAGNSNQEEGRRKAQHLEGESAIGLHVGIGEGGRKSSKYYCESSY